MKVKIIAFISSLIVLTGAISIIKTSTNPLLRFGVIESLTSGDRLEDILVPYSRTIPYTMEPPLYYPGYMLQYKTRIEREANFNYGGVHYCIPFIAHTEIQITCCGVGGTGYDDCAAWSDDTDKEKCTYYWGQTSQSSTNWYKFWN